VRDSLLGSPRSDWDLATSARPEDVRRIFRRTVPVGIEHGTVGVLASDGVLYEVTTFRRDVETFGRHAVIEFAHTIDEDLARRDFTFNAIAWHPITDEIRDPHDGLEDLRRGTLRTVGNRRSALPRTTSACCAGSASPVTSCSSRARRGMRWWPQCRS
jgi:tRNA nucleotidyltransferase (CCA-adding enzyme)